MNSVRNGAPGGPHPQYKWLGLHPTEEAARAKLAQYKVSEEAWVEMIVFGK